MVSSDTELIEQVRGMTDYDASVMSDSEIQTLVDIGKEEIAGYLVADDETPSDFTFYSGNYDADRALFWFTCIAAKAKAGEIASVNLTVGSLRSTAYAGSKFELYFENFDKKMRGAENGNLPATSAPERDGRSYGEQL